MERYDTNLWKFLKENDEYSLGLYERLNIATEFMKKVEEIKSRNVQNRDLKPSNVLLNLTLDKKWNGQMEITDFGIANIGTTQFGGEKAGTCGWVESKQITDGHNFDFFAARLMVFMILLTWKRAWSFIWDGTTSVNQADQIETLFIGCKGKKDIPKLPSEIGSRISSQSFVDEWYLYCRSATASFNIDSTRRN